VWLLLAALSPGCAWLNQRLASLGAEPPAAEKPQTPAGEIRGGYYLLPEMGLGWQPPRGWEPFRPNPGQSFVVGWRQGRSRVWMWRLPPGPELAAAAAELAVRLDWGLAGGRRVSWLGRPAWSARVGAEAGLGRLRLLSLPTGVVAVAGLGSGRSEARVRAALAQAMDGVFVISPGEVLHVVQYRRETLSLLALWYTDQAANWPRLMEHNSLRREELRLGQAILIPADLVRRCSPLPGWAVSLAQRPAPAPEPGAREPDPAEPARAPHPMEAPEPGPLLRPAGPK
jgi:hypothetical protein